MLKVFNTGYIYFDIFLYLILFCKLIFIFLTIFDSVLIKKKIISKNVTDGLLNFSEHAFMILMCILLIILFNPITEKYMILDHHIKLFLFAFGILELISQMKLPKQIKKVLSL